MAKGDAVLGTVCYHLESFVQYMEDPGITSQSSRVHHPYAPFVRS